jgi:hypothetical protein
MGYQKRLIESDEFPTKAVNIHLKNAYFLALKEDGSYI